MPVSVWLARLLRLALAIAISLAPSLSLADMTAVRVRMQSGQEVAITDLPMTRFIRMYPFGQQVFSTGTLAFQEHVLFGVPNYCPHGWYWSWSSGFTQEMIDQRKETCSRDQRSKLTFLPEQDRGICDCKLVMRTERIKAIGQEPLMQSLDDDALLNDQFKMARRIRHGNEYLPILISLSGAGQGEIYDYSGNLLCRASGRKDDGGRREPDRDLLLIRSGRAPPLRIECLGGRGGSVDFSDIRYSILRQRTEGVIRIRFDNGESYEVVQ